jgi:predicted membrane channel-forming protein YqfA (hemolysin III family)
LRSELAFRLNSLIPWSSLSSIGNTTAARLTILAPLIGYLVIYNQAIAGFFFLSKDAVISTQPEDSLLSLLRNMKLTFLYFGLLFFGVGTIIFGIFSPRSIRRYKSAEEYVLASEAAQTEWLIIDNLTRVGKSAWKGEYHENKDSYGQVTLSFTEDTLYQLDAILDFAGHNALFETDEAKPQEESGSEFVGRFFNMMGNVKTDQVLEFLLSKRRVDRVYWHMAIGAIVKHRPREVFYMTYTFDEWSRFSARVSCAAMFAIGGIFLALPTLITSAEILAQVFS